MLIFCLCLLAMFLFWLFGHIMGTILYLSILFVGHFILVLLFITYYFDKSGYCFWHQKYLSDAGANYSHSFTCISTNDILAASSQFITK